MLHIYLLGGFHLTYEGQPIQIASTRLQALLAYLVLHADMPQSRQGLAYLFWPDSSESQAFTNLRKLIYQLRQTLPHPDRFFQSDQQRIEWIKDAPYTTDVNKLRSYLTQSKRAFPAQTAFIQIAEIYRGRLLPDCYDEWIAPRRGQLHQEVVDTIGQLLIVLEKQRSYEEAIRCAHYLLTLEPLEEATYRHLMRLYALSGNRVGVQHAYQQCARMLEEELDVQPSVETQQLYTQMKELLAAPTEKVIVAQGPPVETIPLIGRMHEWTQLQAAWQKALSGHAQFVAIGGEAGIGKSRLAAELLKWAGYYGARTARTRSYAAQGALAYAPVVELLRSPSVYSQLEKLAGVWLVEVARLLPELLESKANLPAAEPIRENWQRQRLWDALVHAVCGDERQPLLLLLDDLQWCDHETLTWLTYLLQSHAETRLLVVGTVRDDELLSDHPFTMLQLELQRVDQFQMIPLTALSAAESRALAAEIAPGAMTEAQAQQLFHDTEGNPLFIVEMIRARHLALPELSLSQNPQLGNSIPTPLPALPPKIFATIRHRLLQLSRPAYELAGVAAVIGRSFSLELLIAASGQDEHSLVAALDELWRRRLVREQGREYDFTHDRIRDVAYVTVGQVRAKYLHCRIAQALEQLDGAKLDGATLQIANHYEKAGDLQNTLVYLQRVVSVAQHIYAYAEAIRLLRYALELMERENCLEENATLRLELLTQWATMLAETQGTASPEVEEVYRQVQKINTSTEAPPISVPLLQGMASYYRVHGDYTTALEVDCQLLDMAQESRVVQHLVAAHFEIGATYYMRGELANAHNHLAQSAHLCTTHQSYARPHSTLAEVLWLLGLPDQALQRCYEALSLVQDHGTPYDVVAELGTTAELRLLAGVQVRVNEDLAQFHELVCRYGYTQFETWDRYLHGWAMIASQGLQGVAQMEIALQDFQATNARARLSRFFGLITKGYLDCGEIEKAETILAKAMKHVEEHSERFWEAELCRLQGEILLRQGGDNDHLAEAWYRRAIEKARSQQAKMLELRAATSLAKVWLSQGQHERANALLHELLDEFNEGWATPDLQNAQRLLSTCT